MDNGQLNILLDAFEEARKHNSLEYKRAVFEDLRTHFFLHEASKEIIDSVLASCIEDDDIRHLGVRIVQLASSDAYHAYRKKLIDVGACGTLLFLVRMTLDPLTREEIVALGHRIHTLSLKIEMHDEMLLFVTAKDTPTMSELDCIRLERQLGYKTRQVTNGQ